jgi:AbrB family looped-hinge helix DNA binding protein
MATATKSTTPPFIRAKVTSKGQVTIPVEVRKSLGIRPGDHLRFEQEGREIRLVREPNENVFEKWRGIGVPGMEPGREGVIAFMRELRGYDDFDDNLG